MLTCVGFGALFRPLDTSVVDEELETGAFIGRSTSNQETELKQLDSAAKDSQPNGQPPHINLNGKTPVSPTSNGTTSEGRILLLEWIIK